MWASTRWRLFCAFRSSLTRQQELAAPDADTSNLRLFLRRGVGAFAIPLPIDGIAALDKPAVGVTPVGAKAHAYEAVVSITLYEVAAGWPRGCEKLVECRRCLLTAAVVAAVAVLALLPAFRRIDAMQPDSLTGDLDCVSIDHRCTPDKRFCSGGRMAGHKSGREAGNPFLQNCSASWVLAGACMSATCTILSLSSGRGRCRARASSHGAVSHF